MRARFIGDPNSDGEGPSRLSLFGVDFVYGQWADVPDAFAAKIKGNSHFEVEDAAQPDDAEDELTSLRAELDRRGVKYHHFAKAKRLRELLEEDDASGS